MTERVKLPGGTPRPTAEQAARVAENIRSGGEYSLGLTLELAIGENPLCGGMCGTPILEEAKAEKEEGGGPIAEAVDWFIQQESAKEGQQAVG